MMFLFFLLLVILEINYAIHQITQKGPLKDFTGRPMMTSTNNSNPWWPVFKEAVLATGGKLGKPEILSSTTDARFMRQMGIPTLGFSPMKNTPILLHDHNEVRQILQTIAVYVFVLLRLLNIADLFASPNINFPVLGGFCVFGRN